LDSKRDGVSHPQLLHYRQKRQFNTNNPNPNPFEQFFRSLARLRAGAARVGNFVRAVALASSSSDVTPDVPSSEDDPLPGLDALPSTDPQHPFYNKNDYNNFLFRQNLG
jgi:hypothetical protein